MYVHFAGDETAVSSIRVRYGAMIRWLDALPTTDEKPTMVDFWSPG